MALKGSWRRAVSGYVGMSIARWCGRAALAAVLSIVGIGSLVYPAAAEPGGGQWHASSLPFPGAGPSPFPKITNTNCPAVSRCMMVGKYLLADGRQEGIIDTLSSSGVTGITAPLPGDAASDPRAELTTLSCPAVAFCAAAGFYLDTEDGGQGVLETFSGGSWRAVQAPPPANAATPPQVSPSGVSCFRPGACVVVGSYLIPNFVQLGLIETLAGGRWSPTVLPLPPDAAANPQAVPEFVACNGGGRCVTVGFYVNKSAAQVPFVDTLSKGTWTSSVLPLPAGANSQSPKALPFSLSCPVAGSCVAVGRYLDDAGHFQGLTELQNGSTWTAVKAPLPEGAFSDPDLFLKSVSCPVVGRCAAVGAFLFGPEGGDTRGVLEQLSGGQWEPLLVPKPEGDVTNNFPTSVACGQPAACAAAGNTNLNGLLLTLRHGALQTVVAPLPSESSFPQVNFEPESLTCPSPSWCAAGGNFTTETSGGGNATVGLLEILSR